MSVLRLLKFIHPLNKIGAIAIAIDGSLRRPFVFTAWLSLLVGSLLLIFSLADIRWNKDYRFDVPRLPQGPATDDWESAYDEIVMRIGLEINKMKNDSSANTAEIKSVLSEIKSVLSEIKGEYSSLSNQVIMANLKTVTEEIKQNSGYMNDQFNKKFILVGGLLSFILLFLKEDFSECIKNKQPLSIVGDHAIDLCKTDIIWVVLALAVMICISIDIQERCKTNISNAHGAWIARYIEDPILNVSWNLSKSDAHKDGPRNGWEAYLRLTRDDGYKPVSGFHHDDLGRLLLAVQFHYLTIVLYVIYILLLHFAFLKNRSQLHNMIAIMLLGIVQLSILGFAIISRHSSGVFDVKVFPWFWWLSGGSAEAMSIVLGLLPTILLLPIICRLCEGAGILRPRNVLKDIAD